MSVGLPGPPAASRADKLPGYIVAQVFGAIIAAGVLYVIASGGRALRRHALGLAANGYGVRSPGGYSMTAGACRAKS